MGISDEHDGIIELKNKEKEIHQSYKNEIVKKSNNSLKKNI